jgi:hypothetical protein
MLVKFQRPLAQLSDEEVNRHSTKNPKQVTLLEADSKKNP